MVLCSDSRLLPTFIFCFLFSPGTTFMGCVEEDEGLWSIQVLGRRGGGGMLTVVKKSISIVIIIVIY